MRTRGRLLLAAMLPAVGGLVASCGSGVSDFCSSGTPECAADAGGDLSQMGDGSGSSSGGDAAEEGPSTGDARGDTGTDGPGDGNLVCEAGTHDCSGTCVNLGNDPDHCGTCTNKCSGPEAGMGTPLCDNGVCLVQCSGAGMQYCGGDCVSTTDLNNCGMCGNTCNNAPANGMPACTGSPPMCGFTCDSGFHECNGQCLSSDDPSGNPCVLTEQYGVFVATAADGGSDAPGRGTRATPYATISYALANLNGTTRVYVCDGSYSDQVRVTAAVSIYGALTCAQGMWAYSAGTTATVTSTSTTGGPALSIESVSGAVLIEDMWFTAQNASGYDGSGNGNSSIAGWVSASTNVNLVRAAFHAGTGVAGQDGGTPSSNHYSGMMTGNGANGMTGAAQLSCACPDLKTSSTGANGGDGFTVATANFTGMAIAQPGGAGGASPAASGGPPNDGAGGSGEDETFVSGNPTLDNPCTPGHHGASGAPGTGGAGATPLGTLSATGWAAQEGITGGEGNPGQGGGGGGGSVGYGGNPGAGGGGGGCGGCGGAGGLAGTGGGSSFALAVVSSTVALQSPQLSAGAGQSGGNGSTGEAGQGGGGGTIGACSGGAGGAGAGGGGGGGGAGGSSVGIAWTGASTTITVNGTPVTSVGSAGYFSGTSPAGAGGSNGAGGAAAGGGNSGTQSSSLAAAGVVAAVQQF
jgi:hypothetical protein